MRFVIVLFIFLIVSCSTDIPVNNNKIIGADISFVDELEYWDVSFYEKGELKDPLDIFKSHGFNYIRLRIFVNPMGGYNLLDGRSDNQAFCGKERTIEFAKKVKEKGFKLLIDLHYSDTWADPGNQLKPNSWKDLTFNELKTQVFDYTTDIIESFINNGITPDMIQIGNEITNGFMWNDSDSSTDNKKTSGRFTNLDNFTTLLKEGITAVKTSSPTTKIIIHPAALDPIWWMEQIAPYNIDFDIFGISYYPLDHGTVDKLKNDLNLFVASYPQDVIVVEYSKNKKEVNDIVSKLPNGRGLGTFIWEPVNWNSEQAENLFDWVAGEQKGFHTNDLMDDYPM